MSIIYISIRDYRATLVEALDAGEITTFEAWTAWSKMLMLLKKSIFNKTIKKTRRVDALLDTLKYETEELEYCLIEEDC